MARPRTGYAKQDGRPVPGTTTICGMLNKPALVGWAGKTCTTTAWEIGKRGEPLPQWTEILYGQRDDAAAAGTLCHELAEAYIKGTPLPTVPLSDVGAQAWTAFENFVKWIEGQHYTIKSHERPLVSENYGYGGTPDATIHDGDTVYLADWKSSGAFYVENILQGAAYRQLIQECEKVEVKGLHIVRFSRETGDFTHKYLASDALDQGWAVFQRLLDCYPLLRELEKRVR